MAKFILMVLIIGLHQLNLLEIKINIYILDSAALGKLADSAKIQLGKFYCKPQEKIS